MDFLGIAIICFFVLVLFFASKRKNKDRKFVCVFEKIFSIFDIIFSQIKKNDTLEIDYIGKDCVYVNTPNSKIYGIKIYSFEKLDNEFIKQLSKQFQNESDGFFYQVFLKNNTEYRQYVLSYSKDLISAINARVESKVLSGNEIASVLAKFIFVDTQKKSTNLTDEIINHKNDFVANNEVYQSYKAKKGESFYPYVKMRDISFSGVIWGYYDFNLHRIELLKNKLKKMSVVLADDESYAIINFLLIAKDITPDNVNEISEIFNISLVKKSKNVENVCKKTPIKYRDSDWDILVPLSFVSKQFFSKKTENITNE